MLTSFRVVASRLLVATAPALLAWALGVAFLILPPQTADLLKPPVAQGPSGYSQVIRVIDGAPTQRLLAFYLAIFVWAFSIRFWTRWCLDLEPRTILNGGEEAALRRFIPSALMVSAAVTAFVPLYRSAHGTTDLEFATWMILNGVVVVVLALLLLVVCPTSEGDPIDGQAVNAVGQVDPKNARSAQKSKLGFCLAKLPGGRWSFVPWVVGFVGLGLYLAFWPVWLPLQLGAPAIAFIGASLTAGTLIFIVVLARRAFGIPGLLAVAAWMFVGGQLVSNHLIRTVAGLPVDGTSQGGPSLVHRQVDDRPDLRTAIEAWAVRCQVGQKRPKMVIVATAGGASRAALWTARVLHDVERQLDTHVGPGEFRRSLFALSGVSGGSLGAAAYVAAMSPDGCGSVRDDNGRWDMLRDFLVQDFLPPPIGAYLTTDLLARLGFLDLPDRAAALELAWEQEWRDNFRIPEDHSTGHFGTSVGHFGRDSADHFSGTFLSLYMKADSLARYESPPDRERALWDGTVPLLLLNGTHAPTGLPILTSPVRVTQDQFPVALDLLDLVGRDIPLSTAVTNSARFPLVTPGGQLVTRAAKPNGSVMDGGYIENFGADTARDLVAAVKAWQRALASEQKTPEKPDPVRPDILVIQISSDPSLLPDAISRCGERPNQPLVPDTVDNGPQALSDVLGPVTTVAEARGARGARAAGDLARAMCIPPEDASESRNTYVHFALCESDIPGRGTQSAVVGLIPTASDHDRFGPASGCDGCDAFWHCDQAVPSVATGIDDGVGGLEDAIGKVVLA